MSLVYLFPGQGSQFVGMGQDAYQHSPEARATFDIANDLFGKSLSQLCFEGPEDALKETAVQQPALFTTSIAHWRTMQAQGWSAPNFVAGHSLGEFSALVAAGSLSFADGFALVKKRGELMKLAGEQQPGAMAAILALDSETVINLCAQASEETGLPVQLANDNCPGQLVISGEEVALERAVALAKEAKARKVVRLPISIAAHSPLMETAAAAFAEAVADTPIHPPNISIIGNVSAQPLTTVAAIKDEIQAQLTSPVAWTASMRYLLGQDVNTFVEVGPGNVLLSLVKRVNRKTKRIKFEVGAEVCC